MGDDEGDEAEVIDFDWWMRRIADVRGVGQSSLLRSVRSLADTVLFAMQ